MDLSVQNSSLLRPKLVFSNTIIHIASFQMRLANLISPWAAVLLRNRYMHQKCDIEARFFWAGAVSIVLEDPCVRFQEVVLSIP